MRDDGRVARFSRARDIRVVAEAADGLEAIEAVNRSKPDVVLMDTRMPTRDGVDATRRLPGKRVLIVTTYELDEYIVEALRAGPPDSFLKDAPPDELIHAVHAVAAGDALLAPSVTRRLLEQVVRRLPQRPKLPPAHVSHVLGKLGLRDRVQAVVMAYETGLVSPAEHSTI